MRMTNVRQFIRGGYLTAVEPTEVLRGTEVIGEWHPRVGYSVSPPKAQEPPVAVSALAATPKGNVSPDGSVVAPTARVVRSFSKAQQAKGKRA